MNREFENILEICLERVLEKGEDIDDCLQSYPEHASELRPLIEMALAASRALQIEPSPEFRARARYQFRLALDQAASRKRRPSLNWLPRWAAAPLIIVGLLVAGGGTVAAAGYSMPDSPLYPVKLAAEQAQLGLTRSEMGKAELQMELADRRVQEIVYLANKGDADNIEKVTDNLNRRLEKLAGLLATTAESESVQAFGAPAPEATQPPPSITVPAPVITIPPQLVVPSPVPAPTPSAKPRPAPVPTTTPSPTPLPAVPPMALTSGEDTKGGESVDISSEGSEATQETSRDTRAKLKRELARYAAMHPAALQAALDAAPDSSKPALRETIALLLKAYGKTLRALDQP